MPSIKKLLQAAAGNAGGDNLYVEDVFSTYLYEGDSSTGQDINNGIDLSGEGGMVWFKTRSSANGHNIYDTERGNGKLLYITTEAEYTNSTNPWTPSSTGFNTGDDFGGSENQNGEDTVAWTFRKAEKFFDVVTYTGTGSNQAISHNLGSVPGCIIARALSGDNWYVWHNSLSTSGAGSPTGHKRLILNSTAAEDARNGINTITSTSFTVLGSDGETGGSGTSYVAYVFANDAGGFGDDDENIIKCGSYTGNNASTANVINVGFEPQWIMIKGTDRACDWIMVDVMRGATVAPSTSFLEANTSDAEAISTSGYNLVHPTATGFSIPSGVSGNVNEFNEGYIYIAIRRPMKTPESGTEVFTPTFGTGSGFNFIAGFPVDMAIIKEKDNVAPSYASARLTSGTLLITASTAAEFNAPFAVFDSQVGYFEGSLGSNYIGWMFKRATGFFDVVAYTGTGSATTQAHNLGVVPELMIIKRRDGVVHWAVYSAARTSAYTIALESSVAEFSGASYWNGTEPTASVFTVNTHSSVNLSGGTYIAYLFATLAGVSKVGSYTGTGSDLNVDCGFSAGARFILIKRTDSTGDWYVWDSARGIVAGNDPYLLLNSTAAEVTSTDYIDPLSSGFTVTSSAPAALNASGGTYIFLAIA